LKELPSISIIIPVYNCEKVLSLCLRSIREQDYPKEKIEIIAIDGGSIDDTLGIARLFSARTLVSADDQQNPERRKAIGLEYADNEIIAFIDSDNILPHNKWLAKMVRPFWKDERVIATQPLRYAYNKSHSLLNRYFALFGANDPIAYYFNKRDRLSWAENSWKLPGSAEDKGDYYLVKFEPGNVPTLGANGFLVRRDILLRARCSPSEFFHIDVNCDLIKLGYNTYGIVKEDIIHLTSNTFFSFMGKRLEYMKRYCLQDHSLRRYHMYHAPSDRWKLAKYIIYSLTLVKPIYDSFKGYRKVRDFAWFLHPVMCLSILFVYGFAMVDWELSSLAKRLGVRGGTYE